MKLILIIIIVFVIVIKGIYSQSSGTIYLFPGQGSDKRIFDSISLKSAYKLKIIEYGTPEKKMTLNSFASSLSSQIDTTENFVLIGVSLGGMICVELSEILNPKKTILISSAKNRQELPFRYRFQKAIPLYKLIPKRVILAGAKILQPIVEPDRNNSKMIFKNMLAAKNALYMKRTVGLIINWERKENSKEIFHIHGNYDHTLPIRKIKTPTITVNKGSHMMCLTKSKEISNYINLLLDN
jgi:pimeloyl-ACP methyl ester carboxylesterase